MNYSKGFIPSGANDSFISSPTIELPLDEIPFSEEPTGWAPMSKPTTTNTTTSYNSYNKRKTTNTKSQDVVVQSIPAPAISLSKKNNSSITKPNVTLLSSSSSSEDEEDDEEKEYLPSALASSSSRQNSVFKKVPPLSQTIQEVLPEMVTPSWLSICGTGSNTPTTSRPHLTVTYARHGQYHLTKTTRARSRW